MLQDITTDQAGKKLNLRLLSIVALYFVCWAGSAQVAAQCSLSGLPSSTESGVRDDVLIIVNENSVDSCDVGRHYALERNVPADNVVRLHVPPMYWIDEIEFRSLRDQIIYHMANTASIIKDNPTPANMPDCEQTGTTKYYCPATADWLRNNTKIRYIVLTKGVPTLMHPPGAPTQEFTSVSNYLRYWIVRYLDDSVSEQPMNFLDREVAFGDGRRMREVDTALDGELIVTHIDGLDKAHAKELVKRAVEAEDNGLYGKFYADQFDYGGSFEYGVPQWKDYEKNTQVYRNPPGTSANGHDAWKYGYGLFNERRQVCEDYIPHDPSNPGGIGIAPQDCQIKFARRVPGLRGPDPANPGQEISLSKTPIVDKALVYYDEIQGHASGHDRFDTFNYWVKDIGCAPALCREYADPPYFDPEADPSLEEQCRIASTDAKREINTACIGVAEGFIGYHMRSYPMNWLAAWPTGWNGPNIHTEVFNFPVVSDAVGSGNGDDHALWFGNEETIVDPKCYAYKDGSTVYFNEAYDTTPPPYNCVTDYIAYIEQTITLDEPVIIDANNPQEFTLSFDYKTENILSGSVLEVLVEVYDPDEIGNWVTHGNILTPFSSDQDWQTVTSAAFVIDAAKHATTTPQYTKIRVSIVSLKFAGDLAIDNVSLIETNIGERLTNGSFDQGHEQVHIGDHGAMFLSRLNGAGFWGSVGHWESGGRSFGKNPLETLIYFFRGLPFGDAVWWGETRNSGLVYGDPLYSPVDVQLDYLQSPQRNPYMERDYAFINDSVALHGTTRNGKSPQVTTTYSLYYCDYDIDFYECDRHSTWIAIGQENQTATLDEHYLLSNWDTTGLTPGNHTLRLDVTSTKVTEETQSFSDHLPVILIDGNDDGDDDGLTNYQELEIYGSDPNYPDMDDDGLDDGAEVALGTDIFLVDTDGDGIDDLDETIIGTNPTLNDSLLDLDEDGVINIIEFLRDPDGVDDKLITPVLNDWYVDQSYTQGDDTGSISQPFQDISVAFETAEPGDTVYVKGIYDSTENISISNAMRVMGMTIDGVRAQLIAPRINLPAQQEFVELSNFDLVQRAGSTSSPFLLLRSTNKTVKQNRIFVSEPNTTAIGAGGGAGNRFITNNVILGGAAMEGIVTGSANIVNNTIVGFDVGIRKDASASSMLLENNILLNVDDVVDLQVADIVQHNLLNDAELVNQFFNIGGMPDFEDAATQNYHLKPLSLGIDSGNPASDYDDEPGFNGNRINMGAYGGTSEATSKYKVLNLPILYMLIHSA